MENVNHDTLLLIFVACTAAAVVLQACILLALYLAFRSGMKTIQEQIKEIRVNVLPVVNETKLLLIDVGPKISSLVGDIVALSDDLRSQGTIIRSSASEIVEKVNRQATRLDSILTRAFDVADHASIVVADAISVPLRQLSALSAFAKAAVNTLIGGVPRRPPTPQRARVQAGKGQFM